MGRLYSESIEELIGAPIMAAAEGIDYRLHAAGREDIDTRTLGSGRPFVIEIFKPKRRKLNLEHLANIINSLAAGKIKVSELKFSSKKAVRMFKSAGQSTKIYRAVVEFGREVDESELKLLNETFSNKLLSQFTPTRVAHRRAPKIRKKYIYEVEARSLQPKRAELLIRCQGGLYVKEFISGDEGRTKPSVAEVLNTEAKCVELDLLDVELKEERSGEV
jgi:tRNA pseudouridine synthase 10